MGVTCAHRFNDEPSEGPAVSSQIINRVVDFKLYLNSEQEATLTSWLNSCCWIYNRALEHRIKAYRRRQQSISLYDQQKLLTKWRDRIESLRLIPAQFERDGLRRVDRGFKAFFRRLKAGDKPGFPRFRSRHRYNSLEQLQPGNFVREKAIFIPGIGEVRARGLKQDTSGKQKAIRIIRRPSGWYAHVIFEREMPNVDRTGIKQSVGVDLGLLAFATLSIGEKIENPRWYRKSQEERTRLSKRMARKKIGSNNRRAARERLARHHERIAAQRKDFAHQESRKLANNFGIIVHEKLSVAGLAAGMLSKSVHDAGWSQFLFFVTYKAECAGGKAIGIDPRGTSQECPKCGAIRKKSMSERIHSCACGCVIDRDVAAAQVILARGATVIAPSTPAEELASTDRLVPSSKSVRRSRKSHSTQ
jgi:putative transposase